MSTFGVVGLGRIGGGLALQALRKGHMVYGFDPVPAREELREAGLQIADSLSELVDAMPTPRVIFLYVHAGPLVDTLLTGLIPLLDAGDIVVDGGNSYWGDSIRRQQALLEHGIHLVDLGTSGGLMGAEHGACFMMGGLPEAKAPVVEIVQRLCVEGGFVDAGGPGSGHYVKLVHNGIEFGMLQAIGEGIDLLERFHQDLPITQVLSCWQNGSVVRSWLIDLMQAAYASQDGMDGVPAYIEDTGEVNWLVADAMQMEVPIPVISQSVMQLFASRDQNKHWAKAIAMMRHGFGGHPFGPDDALRADRQTSRVGDIFRPDTV